MSIKNDKYLQTGKIVNTHGINGELKIQSWADDTEFLLDFDEFYLDDLTVLEVNSSRIHKGHLLAKFKGIKNINDAEKYKNKIIYINKDDVELEEDCYFIADLLGCEVFDIDTNKSYGNIKEVLQTGANDVYIIHNYSEDKDYLVPVIDDVVKEINISSKTVLIKPLDGLFD